MRSLSVCKILSVILLSGLCLARGGGSGGSSGDSSSGSSGSSSGGSSSDGAYDDGEDSGNSSSGGSSSGGGTYAPYTPPCTSCNCRQVARRIQLYELPGSYYKGTITIRHQITDNSARDVAALSASGAIKCPADDSSRKTYSYPALFTIGSNLNVSDTNPVFWNLRGFPIPDRYGTSPNHIDVFFDWTHIRNSDFVATDHSEWTSTDLASSFPHQQHTYWTTTLTSTGPSTWSANASYTFQPQRERSFSAPTTSDYLTLCSSNYITLVDVCASDQELYGSSGHKSPSSPWPLDNIDSTSIPTILFDLGAQASISGIGSPSLSLNITNASVKSQVVPVSSATSCADTIAGSASSPIYYRTLQPCQWRNVPYISSDRQDFWNISAAVEIRFEGTLVVENSTRILEGSQGGDRPVCGLGNKASATATGGLTGSTRIATSAAAGGNLSGERLRMVMVISLCLLDSGVLTR